MWTQPSESPAPQGAVNAFSLGGGINLGPLKTVKEIMKDEEGFQMVEGKKRMKAIKKGQWSKLDLGNELEEEENLGSINMMGEGVWECIEVNMDSGAIDHVINPDLAKMFETKPTERSLKGSYYEAANGTPIKNYGEKDVVGQTEDGSDIGITFQAADVKGTLGAVQKICAAGNYVLFDDTGGIIINKTSGKKTGFELNEKGIYALKIWVKNQSFQRQGA